MAQQTYQCSNCFLGYKDSPQRYGPPVPHPKSECLPRVRLQVEDAAKALENAQRRLAKAEAEVYA